MSLNKKHINAMVVSFFLIIIAIVFYQIATSMAEQGIASGSPYDNAAAYPRALAIIIGGLLLLQTVISLLTKIRKEEHQSTQIRDLYRPAALLAIFGVYLGVLGWFGYHLTTTPMLIAIMWIAGVRQIKILLLVGLGISFLFAFLFEVFLKIVLPGGVYSLNIPW